MDSNAIIGLAIEYHRQPMQSLLARPLEASETAEPLVDAMGHHGFTIRAADSAGERSSANVLIKRAYAGRGYRHNPLPDEDDPNRLTLVARDHEAVIGTLTIGFDSKAGLLVDEIFQDEVDALRNAGRQVCEFTKLAMEGVVRSQRVLAAMFHVAFIQAHRIRGCDNLLIEVNPRHTRYYETKLGFQRLGPERLNRRVDAPAVLLSLDLWYAHDQVDKFGGKPEPHAGERSLYPFGFSVSERAGIVERLRRQQRGAARAASFRDRARS